MRNIYCLSLQQRLHERDSMLRHTCIADLVKTYSTSPFQYEETTILSKGCELTTNNNNVAEGDRNNSVLLPAKQETTTAANYSI